MTNFKERAINLLKIFASFYNFFLLTDMTHEGTKQLLQFSKQYPMQKMGNCFPLPCLLMVMFFVTGVNRFCFIVVLDRQQMQLCTKNIQKYLAVSYVKHVSTVCSCHM